MTEIIDMVKWNRLMLLAIATQVGLSKKTLREINEQCKIK